MGNRNRAIEPSNGSGPGPLPVGGGRHDIISHIRCVHQGMGVYKKVPQTKGDFHASLWAGRGQNTVCPWGVEENHKLW